MTQIKPLVIKVSYDYIPSINNMYMPRWNGKGLMLTPEVRSFKSTILNCLNDLDTRVNWNNEYPWVFNDPWISLEIHVLFNQSFYKRDASNIVKASEDVLAQFMQIDDRNNLEVTVKKFYVPSSPKEYLIFIMQPSTLDYMVYEEKFKTES